MNKIYLFLALFLIVGPLRPAAAEIQWQIPGGIGTINIPTGPADLIPVIGYDYIQKQLITGASAGVLTIYKEVNGYVGAVGEWQTQAPNIQPYLSIGSDFARYVPILRQIQNLEIHAFVRYVASSDLHNHLGAGGAICYKWGLPSRTIPQAPSEPPAPTATLPPVGVK